MKTAKYFFLTNLILLFFSAYSIFCEGVNKEFPLKEEVDIAKKIKAMPNDIDIIYKAYDFSYSNHFFSEQWLTSWRYLLVEADISKSKPVLDYFLRMLTANTKTIYVSTESQQKDGIGSSLELNFGLLKMGFNANLNKENYFTKTVDFFKLFFSLIKKSFEEKENILEGKEPLLYVLSPFFIELNEKNFTEPFVYRIFKSSGEPNVDLWLKNNSTMVDEMMEWSNNYRW